MALVRSNTQAPPSPPPSAGVLLAYFNIYLEHEKQIIDKTKSLEIVPKDEIKDAQSSYYNIFSNFISTSVESIRNTFKNIRQTIQSTIDHITGTDEKLRKIYKWLLNKLEPENPNDPLTPPPEQWTWDQWIEFAIELRHKGSKAQEAKTTAGQSRCCEIFFALADYILVTTMQNEEGKKAYIAKIQALRSEIAKKEEEILVQSGADGKTKPNATRVKDLNNDLDKLILNLAYLGDLKAILKASVRAGTEKRKGLLDHLYSVNQKEAEQGSEFTSSCRKLSTFNEVISYPLQWHFAQICFTDREFYKYAKNGFGEFALDARKTYQDRMEKKAQEQVRKKEQPIVQPEPPKQPLAEDNSYNVDFSNLGKILIVPDYDYDPSAPPKKDAPPKDRVQTEEELAEGQEQDTTLLDNNVDQRLDEEEAPDNSINQTTVIKQQQDTTSANKGMIPAKTTDAAPRKPNAVGMFPVKKILPAPPPVTIPPENKTTPRPGGNNQET